MIVEATMNVPSKISRDIEFAPLSSCKNPNQCFSILIPIAFIVENVAGDVLEQFHNYLKSSGKNIVIPGLLPGEGQAGPAPSDKAVTIPK